MIVLSSHLSSMQVCTNYMEASTTGSPLFYFDIEGNTRDVFCSSDCDDGVQMLGQEGSWLLRCVFLCPSVNQASQSFLHVQTVSAGLAGWGPDLESIVSQYTDTQIQCKQYIRPAFQPVMRESYVDEGKKKRTPLLNPFTSPSFFNPLFLFHLPPPYDDRAPSLSHFSFNR